MINSWCPLLSNGYRFATTSDRKLAYSPCCWIYPVEFSDQLGLKKCKQATQYFAIKDPDKYCSSCITRESAGKLSMRQTYSKVMQDFAYNEFTVEVSSDIRCNAACVMCGPHLSTSWQKELGIPVLTTEQQQEDSVELITKSINIQKVRLWHFVGGEPFLVSTHKRILQQINDLSNVTVTYHTNGSILPDSETLDIWKQAKHCLVQFSIDATQDQFEYIRYPLKWDTVVSNIRQYLCYVKELQNLRVGIHVTVSPLNLLHLCDIERFVNELLSETGIYIKTEFDICSGRFDLSGTPQSLREAAADVYKPNHIALNFLKQLPYNQTKAEELVTEADALDRRRNLNWRDVFPLTSKHFETL